VKLVRVVARICNLPRREAAKLIDSGQVTVNQVVQTSYAFEVDEENDLVRLTTDNLGNTSSNSKSKTSSSHKKLSNNSRTSSAAYKLGFSAKYFVYYKPKGLECTLADKASGLGSVIEQIGFADLKPVGRLDRESEGLLLMSNDGDFINKMTHPKEKVKKVYRVWIPLINDSAQKEALKELLNVKFLSVASELQELEITLFEGQNRQIRRTLASVGLHVQSLIRISVGGYSLQDLKPGAWREVKI
jgi:pseudouridine synthase